jgi:2,3-bisphosphoglycerate-dependent phosphoglycerate mutase
VSGTGTLVLLRHGESTHNAAQRFTGLLDVELSDLGAEQARDAALLLLRAGAIPDLVLTSPLRRARRTAEAVIAELGIDVPLVARWRLEERDYGVLTGMAKHQVRERFGADKFFEWRRTLHGKPPAARPEDVAGWGLVSTRPPGMRAPGSGESLHDVIERVRPCWEGEIREALRAGRCVLVVAHGNSLRALCALIDDLDEDELEALNLPQGQPIVYDVVSDDGGVVPGSGRYIDVEAALAVAAVIAIEGGT